ncbi:hypothetical protein ACFL6S_24330 [Candidatus Poribacteria bacterium]
MDRDIISDKAHGSVLFATSSLDLSLANAVEVILYWESGRSKNYVYFHRIGPDHL